jgi:hypothetical protein
VAPRPNCTQVINRDLLAFVIRYLPFYQRSQFIGAFVDTQASLFALMHLLPSFAARHFEGMEADEEECIGVSGAFKRALDLVGLRRRLTAYPASSESATWCGRPLRRSRSLYKVTRSDENGIVDLLASVQRFYADTETYDVQERRRYESKLGFVCPVPSRFNG